MNIQDDQFLTVKELSARIKYSQQTIYNMIHQGQFVRGEHYVKPGRKKVLFLWSAICKWLESREVSGNEIQQTSASRNEKMNKSIINI